MARSIVAPIFALCLLLVFCRDGRSQPQSSQSSMHFPEAETLVQQGRLDEAKTELLLELQRTPSSADGYNLLGIIESKQSDYEAAINAFKEALRLSPKSTKTHNNMGNVFVAQKRLDLADREFRTVLRLDPANRDANYNLGVLLMARKMPAEAITHFERVRPPDTATSFNLIQAHFQSKHAAQALRMATELSSTHNDDVQVHFSLGVLLAKEQQYKPAQLELEKADALQPGTFEILYNLGQVLLRGGDNSAAERTLSRALKLDPSSAETLYLLAMAYSNESRPLDALDQLLRAHKLAPQNTDVIFLMAQISMSQNYFEDAIPLLESGIQIAPQRTDMLAALGESYFMSGKVDKAVDEFKKLLALDVSPRSYAFLGLSYRSLGRFDEARQYFKQGLKLDPHNTSCLFNLGFIAERQGDSTAAEVIFQQLLDANPHYPDALLELANIQIAKRRFTEASELLRKYVQVSHNPATGYYKLAMLERSLHQTAAADRDLKTFQALSKRVASNPYPYEHLFDYLDSRAKLAPVAREQLDLSELVDEIKKHPDQPQDLYMLAEAYLKTGKVDEARGTVMQLDALSSGDYRTLTGTGVLLARYHLYDDAIQHFKLALQVNPGSDEIKFDLANAYFRKRSYSEALSTAEEISQTGRKDDAYLALLGDIYAHLGDNDRATAIFRDAISRNPDNDQDYLALALLEFRQNNVTAGKQTLLNGQLRIPSSGKIFWGLGLASALEGNTAKAAEQFERAVDLLPEWSGSYSTLGVFYFQTGQIEKAKEVLNRFKNSSVSGGLDVGRIEQVLSQAPATPSIENQPITAGNREQLLQLALTLAERTL